MRIIAQWQIHRAYANTRKGVIAMLKRANGRGEKSALPEGSLSGRPKSGADRGHPVQTIRSLELLIKDKWKGIYSLQVVCDCKGDPQ